MWQVYEAKRKTVPRSSGMYLKFWRGKVTHSVLIMKINKLLPIPFIELLQWSAEKGIFSVKFEVEYSHTKSVRAAVSQGSVLIPVVNLLYSNNLPSAHYITTATFADDIPFMAVWSNPTHVFHKLQKQWTQSAAWLKIRELSPRINPILETSPAKELRK